jgi:hypothetical protein
MKRTYLTHHHLAALVASLTDRDHSVLTTVARVRVATSVQLERLHFSDVTRRQARQLLAGMVRRRLLARLPRTIGGARAGSAGYVYGLDVAGARIVSDDGRRRPGQLGTAFLAHSLDVTELYVRLVEADRLKAFELLNFVAEPACWRSFAGPGGGRVTLKPDAYVVVKRGEHEDRWFVEVDRDTEAVPTLARKCDTYRRYWQSGTEQARSGIFPRVLFLVPDTQRYRTLVGVFGRQPVEAWPLFVVALYEQAAEPACVNFPLPALTAW